MERFDWNLTIKTNLFLLKIAGLWPNGDETYKLDLYAFYACISLTLFVVCHNLCITINLFVSIDDLEAATAILFVLLVQLMAIIKSYYLVRNMDILKQLTIASNSDIFQPRNEKQMKLVEPLLKAWTTFFWAYWTNAITTLLLWAAFPILDKTIKEFRLPLLVWYPYNFKISPFYEITYIYQVICFNFITIVNISVDTLIGAFNMFIAAQCELLCDNLQNMKFPESDGSCIKWLECIMHHKGILKFAENLQKFYNWLVLFQFFTSAISIGVTMFQLTIVTPFSSEFYSFVFYLFSVSTEIFVYCWFGNEVEVKSGNIPYAIFRSNWMDASLDAKKQIIIFLLRCQRPIKMSALNVFYLSLDTFTRILRTAWSYFALLHQVNSQ